AMTALRLGGVTVSRVVEIDRSSFRTTEMLPESTRAGVEAHAGWLAPYWDHAVGDLASRIGTWVVRTPTRTILVDTGVGNDKARTGAALWHMRQGRYLEELAALGVTPEGVDLVLCTHLHVDHVGWNTRRVDDRWVPTFPNATYVLAGEEWEFWRHECEAGREESGCIADSVLPVVQAGRARLVGADHDLGEGLFLEPSPGHTPGHVCLRLRTAAGEAVFSGDLMHRVVQVAEPRWSSRFCHDAARARRTREAFLERFADTGVLVLAAHFPAPGYVVRRDGGFRFVAA
ncbi:MAG TPA: MBL fold metallo-hydrolase, partial [Methylomirabilota bacterium]|nr:MBL fold metallo-hydrolase [Methylomirabilota bacterium]